MSGMQYRVVSGDVNKSLSEAVNEMIAEGWRPQGGVSTMQTGMSGWVLCQAMVRGESEPSKAEKVLEVLLEGTEAALAHPDASKSPPDLVEMLTEIRDAAKRGLDDD